MSKAQQIVNVLEIDLLSNKYKVEFTYNNGDSLSTTAQVRGAIGGINGGYEQEAIYIRINGTNISEVTLPEGHLRYWKHDGALYSDGNLILELYMAAEMERLQLIHINNILQSIC